MLLPRREDIVHKAWLLRLLTAICDNSLLAFVLRFKGGTCAAMQGFINRFSIDLDFDLMLGNEKIEDVRNQFETIFKKLDIIIKDQSAYTPQYFLKYDAPEGKRNSIKIDVVFPPPKANQYEKIHLSDIDRIFTCQTKETLFANKLVSIIDRYEKTGAIAGRDLFDIHSYFLKGFEYNKKVIIERRNKNIKDFFKELIEFIEKKVTNTVINQDLNHLLPNFDFQKIQKILKPEVLMFINEELKRIS